MFSTMKSTPRQVKEAKKAYERVVDHLVAEGYARNKTDADNIIGGMSEEWYSICLLYTSPSPRDVEESRMPSSA